jgi:hypothetical protein
MDHPLTDAFRGTRKLYTLFAGLLIAWELIGLRLGASAEQEQLEEVTGKVFDLPITVLSPNAAPFVLLVLLLYFAFRTELEWQYCSPGEEHQRIARWDHWSAHVIAMAAVALFAVQRILEIQVADRVTGGSREADFWAATGFTLTGLLCWLAMRKELFKWLANRWPRFSHESVSWSLHSLVTCLSVTISAYFLYRNDWNLRPTWEAIPWVLQGGFLFILLIGAISALQQKLLGTSSKRADPNP